MAISGPGDLRHLPYLHATGLLGALAPVGAEAVSWRLTCDVLRYTNADTVTRVACPTFVTDNETNEVSTGQGKILFEHLTCPKEFRLFKKEEGAEGHCEGMAPIVFWDAAFNWLDALLPN